MRKGEQTPWIVSDDLWAEIAPLLPPRPPRRHRFPGHKPLDDRKVLCGILVVLYTSTPWEYLPQETGFRFGDDLLAPVAGLEGSVALSVGVIEADLIGEVVGSSSLVAATEVGVRWLPVPKELLVERGVEVDHVTVYRWVQRFTPLLADAARFCRHSPAGFQNAVIVADLAGCGG